MSKLITDFEVLSLGDKYCIKIPAYLNNHHLVDGAEYWVNNKVVYMRFLFKGIPVLSHEVKGISSPVLKRLSCLKQMQVDGVDDNSTVIFSLMLTNICS